MSLFEKIVAAVAPALPPALGREPQATPARIAPIANLPLFHRLHGRRVVVAGGTQGALWKAELVSASGADVAVFAPADAHLFDALAAAPPAGSITVHPRRWEAADLLGAALAIGDISDRAEALSFLAAAKAAGAPANIIDQTDLCEFQFGTIVNRSPVVLAISTDGAAPMLGQSIRTRIEGILPLNLSAWAAAAKAWRPALKGRIDSFADRRAFWERFVERTWSDVSRAPTSTDFDELVDATTSSSRVGSVTLVGAGPGDPELLTLKAVRALQTATVILYDDLVGPDILELARRESRRIAVGKTGHGPSCSQADINRQIIDLALAGERVVRLKGGDPLIFGRATEEIEACEAAGVPVSIVPGITAAQGAAAALGFSLTERYSARRIQFVTGHGADGRLPDDIDWRAIADPLATTVVYMPRKTLAAFVDAAVAAGLDPDTPALAVGSATRADQAHVAGTVQDIARLAETLPPGAPVCAILGAVARDRSRATAALAPALAAAA